jgi:hypothetical protein
MLEFKEQVRSAGSVAFAHAFGGIMKCGICNFMYSLKLDKRIDYVGV